MVSVFSLPSSFSRVLVRALTDLDRAQNRRAPRAHEESRRLPSLVE
jgi:hypothetical protein